MGDPVSLVVTDLDGTLWHTDSAVPTEAVGAIAELERRGVPVLVATGRRLASTREPLAAIGWAPPAVVLNGALGVDLATGERFHRAPYDPAAAAAVLGAFAAAGLRPVVHVDHEVWHAFLAPEPSTNPGHVAAMGDTATTDDLSRVVAEEVVLGFSMIGVPHGQAVAGAEALGDIAEVHVDRSLEYAGYTTFTAAPKGQSKWDGVVAFCTARGLDATRVLALADGPNDIELLDAAAVRLVPEVAHPAALERSDHLIPPASAGGWAAVLDHVT